MRGCLRAEKGWEVAEGNEGPGTSERTDWLIVLSPRSKRVPLCFANGTDLNF